LLGLIPQQNRNGNTALQSYTPDFFTLSPT